MAMHITRLARDLDDTDRVVELTGRVVRPLLRSAPLPIPDGGLASDHPALLLLREVAELRVAVEAKNAEIAAAYERECDLVRILHRYVIQEQSGSQ